MTDGDVARFRQRAEEGLFSGETPEKSSELIFGRGSTVRTFVTGGAARGPGERKIAPPTFQSQLLQQDFPSASARQKAEAKFRTTQAAELRASQRLETTRLEGVRGRRITGQIIAAPEPVGFFETRLAGIRESRAKRARDTGFGARGLTTAGAFVEPFLGAGLFAKQLFSRPRETISGIGPGLRSTAQFVTGGGLATQLRTQPELVVGRVAGELVLFKGTGKAIRLAGRGTELGRTVISPSFRRVRTRELTQFGTTESFIGNIGGIGGTGEIALIPAGLERAAPTLRPSVRGGFGFTQAEQTALIKQQGPLVSAQADLPASIFGKPLQKEFFTTPPFEGIGSARISRLGIKGQREATLKDIIGLDFTFKKAKPQIIVFPERKGFKLKATPGSELEVVADIGQVPIRTGQPAVTIVGGRRVPIVTATFGGVSAETAEIFGKARAGARVSARESKRLRKETGFGTSSIVESKPFVSSRRLGVSTGLSISKGIRSGFSFAPSIGSLSTRAVSPKLGKISVFPGGTIGFGTSLAALSPKSISPSITSPVVSPGLISLGIPRVGPTGRLRADTDRRKKKPKKPKKKRKLRFRVAPSFTAQALDIRGIFPKELVSGAGLLPGQIRVLPSRRKRKSKK